MESRNRVSIWRHRWPIAQKLAQPGSDCSCGAGFRILFHRFASENSRDSEANLSNSMMLVASRQPKQRNTENQLHTLPVESINSCLSVEIFQSHTLRLILSNYFDCDWIPTDDHYDPANACMRNLLPQETVTGDPYGGRMTLMNSAKCFSFGGVLRHAKSFSWPLTNAQSLNSLVSRSRRPAQTVRRCFRPFLIARHLKSGTTSLRERRSKTVN